MFFCGYLAYEKEVHKQLDTAGIRENCGHHFVHTVDCFELNLITVQQDVT